MPAPNDYSAAFGGADPSQAFMQGVQQSTVLQDLQMKQQQQQAAMAQQQQQQKALQSLFSNPASGAQDYARVMTAIPQLSEHLKRAWDTKNTDQQQQELSNLSQWMYAIKAGQPDVASSLMRTRADAMERAGLKDQAQALKTKADIVDAHPEFAGGLMMSLAQAHPDGKKLVDNMTAMGAEKRAQDKAPVDLRTAEADATIKGAQAAVATQTEQQKLLTGVWGNANTQSLIQERSAKLGLDRDRLTSETQIKITEMNQKFGQLPDDARKLVNESTVSAVTSEQSLQQYQRLASDIDSLGSSWGSGSSAYEFLKRATGSEDVVSAIKREYTRIASQGVIKLLPPGPASDKDISLAREGVPAANASPQVMSSYLRGMAKLSAYDSVLNNAKAEWAGAVQHLGRAKSDVEIDGIKVPAGTTFNEFARGYLGKKADALMSASEIGGRGYMRFAAPKEPQTGGATGSY